MGKEIVWKRMEGTDDTWLLVPEALSETKESSNVQEFLSPSTIRWFIGGAKRALEQMPNLSERYIPVFLGDKILLAYTPNNKERYAFALFMHDGDRLRLATDLHSALIESGIFYSPVYPNLKIYSPLSEEKREDLLRPFKEMPMIYEAEGDFFGENIDACPLEGELKSHFPERKLDPNSYICLKGRDEKDVYGIQWSDGYLIAKPAIVHEKELKKEMKNLHLISSVRAHGSEKIKYRNQDYDMQIIYAPTSACLSLGCAGKKVRDYFGEPKGNIITSDKFLDLQERYLP